MARPYEYSDEQLKDPEILEQLACNNDELVKLCETQDRHGSASQFRLIARLARALKATLDK